MLRVALVLSLFAMSGLAVAQQTVPFHFRDNLVGVQATIDGRNVSAVLDSGTGAMLVSKSLAAKLGLKQKHSSLQAAGAGGGNQSLFPVKLKSVKFDSLTLRNVSAYAIDLGSLSFSSGFKIDALLGYPFFKNHVVRVNYAKSKVSIYSEENSPVCSKPIPIKLIHNIPVVVAKVKSRSNSVPKTVHLVIDLGSRHHSYLGAAFVRSEPGKTLYADGHKQSVGTGTGGQVMGVVTKFAELSIGTQHFHNVNFALTKQINAFNLKKISGSLGVPLWKRGVITFNYPKHQLCIQTPHK